MEWQDFLFFLQNVNSMKETIINNDAMIAGYLLEEGMSPADVAKVITSEKSAVQIENGKKLLKSIGYKSNMKSTYLPSIKRNSMKITNIICFIFWYIL